MSAVRTTADAPRPGVLRIGLCQVETAPWDMAGNLARTLAAIDAAASGGAEVAVTPECVLHGYADLGEAGAGDRLAACAETVDGASVRAVRDRARMHGLHVLLGFAERGEAGRIHNSAVLIDPAGRVALTYRKVHCRRFERAGDGGAFTPGDSFAVTPLRAREGVFPVGVMICFDREVPESVRCLRARGAALVLCPLATDTSPLHGWRPEADNELVTRVRAAENELVIAVVNHASRFNGGSFVVGARGEVLCQLGAAAEVRVVEVPLGEVAARYHANPHGWMGWGYRRPEVYRHEPL